MSLASQPLRHLLLATVAFGLASGASAQADTSADTLSLGRDAAGEPCTATRRWTDSAIDDPFAASYLITCRSVSASRPLGTVRVVGRTPQALAAIDATFECGLAASESATPLRIAGMAATTRRCVNTAIGAETVRVDIADGSKYIVADAAGGQLGPLEEAIAIIAGGKAPGDPGRATASTIDFTALAPAPTARAGGVAALSPSFALAQGIAYNHRGLHTEASRVLNDALSRLPADASGATRAELLLEAGLADSNIRFSDSADAHFDQADALIASSPDAGTGFLQRKRDAYRALDLLNRRQFQASLAALDRLIVTRVSSDAPLMDPSIVRQINQGRLARAQTADAIAVPDAAELSQLVLDAQANWARSVALLALGNEGAATEAVADARKSYTTLSGERIDQGQILWVGARIARQEARLAARRRDYSAALEGFDTALDLLRRGAIATAGTGNEPAIAEAELERASIFAQSGAEPEAVRDSYAKAVDAVILANASGSAQATGMEGYLDLLVAEAASAPRADTYERFFRAMQASGEPAVARQLSQLRTIVTVDPVLGSKVRDKAELEREVTRLRYEIAAAPTTPGADAGALERERKAAEDRLLAIDAELAGDTRFRAVDDSPATVEEIRAALGPREGFLKIATLGRRAYGVFIAADSTHIYPIARSARDLQVVERVAADLRASIDSQIINDKIVSFDTAGAFGLFGLITGPARDAVLASTSLVVDPAGPLENLPLAALVTSFDPKGARVRGFDYSKVAFLGARATISNAISPRSFLVARSLPASGAARPFMGFGEHNPASTAQAGDGPVDVGFGCSIQGTALAELSRSLEPINRRELEIARDALGVSDAPFLVDAAFSDTAIAARDDLAGFQVLHFATHGLEEGQWGCAKSPPALVTSFGDANSDGLLSFSEIARLRLNANLVVLSACSTAAGVKDEALARSSGQEEAGATLEGLVRAFLTANARAVLATYWQVSAEEETDDFIRTFYTSARTASIGTALQAAQVKLIGQPEFSHPYYWAPYFVVGDSTKPMLSGAQVAGVAMPTKAN